MIKCRQNHFGASHGSRMAQSILIILWALLIGLAAANTAISDADASAVSSSDQIQNDDSEDCDPVTDAPTTTTETPKLQCGANEVYDDCPAECATDYCPKNELESKNSKYYPQPKKCPPPKCKCQFNYRRADNGTCIPTRSCPSFECSGENEVYNSCPPLCPSDDCSQASPDGRCPPQFGNILIVLECAPQCRCREGYWRKNGVCVPYNQCKTPTCGDNEILVDCPADCPSDYCPKSEEDSLKTKCSKPDVCPPPACKCRLNHRRAENGTCIPTRECPPFECSQPNQAFNPCPPFCPTDSCGQATPDGRCPRRFGRIGILLICSPKCRCQKGYWKKDGVCVPYAECGKKDTDVKPTPVIECLDPNEEYNPEKPSCPPEECGSMLARYNCSAFPPPAPGCSCKSGYNRLTTTSPCIPNCQCPELRGALECQDAIKPTPL